MQKISFILNNLSKKYLNIILLVVIILFGSFLRFHQLDKQSYWMDEGYTINAVISAQENGITNNGSSILDSGKTYFCPMYCLPTIGISKIFNNNAFSFRILAVILGILSIILIFFVSKLLFKDNKISLLSTFFMSFSYWQIAWSRQARWYTMFLFFFWLAIFFFYKALYIDKNKISNYTFTILFTILAILTHKLAILLPFIFIFWIIFKNFKNLNKLNKKTILPIIIFLIIPFIISPQFFSNIKNIDLSYNLPYYLNFYLRNYFLFIALAIFYFFNTSKKNKHKIYFLIIPFVFYLFSLSLLTSIVHYRYLFHLTPLFFILGSAGAVDIYKNIKNNHLKNSFILSLILIFFISGQGVIKAQNFYLLEADNPKSFNRPYYAYTPQADFNQAYQVIKDNLQNNDIIISSHPHFNKIFLNRAGYWLKYDYLGFEDKVEEIKNNKEYYVGAEVIDGLANLKNITDNNSGIIVFDYMAQDNRIPPETIDFIRDNLELIFENKINIYSQIWVYRF